VKAKMALPQNKPVPQKSTIIHGLTAILAYGCFRWLSCKIGPHELGRFKVFLDQAVRQHMVMTGC
jgi:hypothetical protein